MERVKKATEVAMPQVSWHALDWQKVLDTLATSAEGLSGQEAKERLKKYGKNLLPEKKPANPFVIFIRQFISPLIFVLAAAAVASLIVGDAKDAAFIALTLLLNSLIGAYQEIKAEKSARALQSLVKISANVKRDGLTVSIPAEGLVPGDIVILEAGFRVPCDLRIIKSNNLSIDESLLTGESLPDRKVIDVMAEDAAMVDRNNMAFAGTVVSTGTGLAVVTGTGAFTELGKIAGTMKESTASKTPLVLRMEKFSLQVSIITVFACIIVAVILLLRGHQVYDVFFVSVALAVSAIPEGLPVALTIAMSVASSRMAKVNVLVRSITAVESLGSCTMIASDKTGTLTVNQQTVKKLVLPGCCEFEVSGEGYNGEGKITGRGETESVLPMIKAACLCNEAVLYESKGKWISTGDSMDVGILSLAYKAGINPDAERKKAVELEIIPYESEKKYSAAIYGDKNKRRVTVKGAVETLSAMCAAGKAEEYEKRADELAALGFRVLAIAEGPYDGKENFSGLSMLGLACFMDPLRKESLEAVQTCKKAGIEVAMLTGDHPATASYIANQLGLKNPSGTAVTGSQLEKAGEKEAEELTFSGRIFARLNPIQKLKAIEVFLKKGFFVAVTGDGANDAPALKKANIGVAMGSGTDIAKDTASLIVLDDNFASIVGGIREGRVAYDNIRKVVYMLLSTGLAAIVLFIMCVIADTPMPLAAVQLLWLNMVTSGFQAAALSFEKAEPGIMERMPRPPSQGIFDKLMVSELVTAGVFIGICGFWIWTNFLPTAGEDEARNMVLLFLVLAQNFQVLNSRSESRSLLSVPFFSNPLLLMVIAGTQLLHLGVMQLPLMQEVLRIGPVSILPWLNTMLLAAAVIPFMEVFKVILRRVKSR